MLIIGREEGESILIGNDTAIVVTRTNVNGHGHRVQIGIIAPPEKRVCRSEASVKALEEHAASQALLMLVPPEDRVRHQQAARP